MIGSAARSLVRGAALAITAGVGCSREPIRLDDDPDLYVAEVEFRRGVLERDLMATGNAYARERLTSYGLEGEAWEILPEHDPPTLPVTVAMVEAHAGGEAIPFDDAAATRLSPARPPTSDEAWIALGRRVFFEYPMRASGGASVLLGQPGALEETGFVAADGAWVGLRLVRDASGAVAAAGTCAQCHASRLEDGSVDAILSNRAMDIGAIRRLAMEHGAGELAPESDAASPHELEALGPGRSDVMDDGVFNPYAFPDLGGIAELPYLQHTANWRNQGVATLAVRCETLFITASRETSRIPRVLTWALARYLRSLPPPPPGVPEPIAGGGDLVFEAAGCPGCHTPPLFTSDRLVGVAEIGTDPAAGESSVRGTGHYRIPSLRGVGRAAPYLHHGAVATLEELFDPGREEPGHPHGLDLEEPERRALIAFLDSL